MSRFLLSPGAVSDLENIRQYLLSLPGPPALYLGRSIQQTLPQLASEPRIGSLHEDYTDISAEPIRRYVSNRYLFFYAADRRPIEFVGIIHGARDADTIMRQRLS